MLDREELAREFRQPRGLDIIGSVESDIAGVEKAVSGTVGQVDANLAHFVGGSAEEAANAIADAFNGPLAGSKIVNGKIVGPIAEVFGSEPVEFAVNAVKFQLGKSVELVKRMRLDRIGKPTVTLSIGGKKRTISLNVTEASPIPNIALAIVACLAVDTTATLDEVHRIMANLNPGKGRGIDGVLMPRGFFGIDDAIFWPCAIALLVGVITILGPSLIAIAGNVASNVGSVVSGKEDIGAGFSNVIAGKGGSTTAAPGTPGGPPATSGGFSLFGFDGTTLAIVGGGLLLILILAFRKKHPSGPPPAPVPPAGG